MPGSPKQFGFHMSRITPMENESSPINQRKEFAVDERVLSVRLTVPAPSALSSAPSVWPIITEGMLIAPGAVPPIANGPPEVLTTITPAAPAFWA